MGFWTWETRVTEEMGSPVTWRGPLGIVIPLLALVLSLAAIGEARLHDYAERVSRMEAHYEHISATLDRIERKLESAEN